MRHLTLVIDTNIVLDLWGFVDPRFALLRAELVRSAKVCQHSDLVDAQSGKSIVAAHSVNIDWVATSSMRDELVSVLSRPHLQTAFASRGGSHDAVIASFDAGTRIVVEPPALSPSAVIRCSDSDDQKFIDLALAHGATLLSKDKAVLKLRRRLSLRSVVVAQQWADELVTNTPGAA